ncbi:MAG: nucleotidyltransferase family protein [Burkholderiaceae bacterium]
MRAAALILAAGRASRFGFEPKCLEVFSETPIIRRLILALSRAEVSPIMVVLGHYASQIKPAIDDLPIETVMNTDPDLGQNSSLRVGLSSLGTAASPVIVSLADQPLLDESAITALLEVYESRPATKRMVVPMRGEQPGNPVIFDASVASEILSMDATYGGKEWRQDHPESVLEWSNSEPSYFVDIDTREYLQALLDSQSRTKR